MPTAAKLLEMKAAEGGDIEVASIEPEASVLDAARLMNDRHIGSLAVVDGEGTLIGMFTERDVLMRVVAESRDPGETLVGEVMTAPVLACPPTTRCEELRALMRQKRIRHLPVVEEGRLLGMSSIGDLTHAETRTLEETVTYLERYIYVP